MESTREPRKPLKMGALTQLGQRQQVHRWDHTAALSTVILDWDCTICYPSASSSALWIPPHLNQLQASRLSLGQEALLPAVCAST